MTPSESEIPNGAVAISHSPDGDFDVLDGGAGAREDHPDAEFCRASCATRCGRGMKRQMFLTRRDVAAARGGDWDVEHGRG